MQLSGCTVWFLAASFCFWIACGPEFCKARPSKMVLPPQREHDFCKIAACKKMPRKSPPGIIYGPKVAKKRRRGIQKSQRALRKVPFGHSWHITRAPLRQRRDVLGPSTAACASRTPGNTLSSNGAEALGVPARAGNSAPATAGARFTQNRSGAPRLQFWR